MLAGMIQSPNPYNPYRHPERATERRNQVLRAMADAEFIHAGHRGGGHGPAAEGRAARRVDTTEAPVLRRPGAAAARRALRRPQDLATQNLSIYTTLDLSLQALAQQALQRGLERVEKMIRSARQAPGPLQGCLIALEPATGASWPWWAAAPTAPASTTA